MLHYEHKKNIPSTESPNFRDGTFATTVDRNDHSGKWQIDWQLSQVKVYYNDAMVLDSAVTLPTGGGDLTQWHIPQAALRPNFLVYGGDGSAGMNWVQWESVVPEPTLGGLALVGLLSVLGRARRRV